MTDNAKAKILLQYGTISKYINSVLKENDYDASIYTEARTDAYSKYESAEIGEEWDDESTSRFIEEGYSKDEVIHSLWDDAIDESKENLIYQEADSLIEEYFENDKDLLKPVVDYLFG